MYTGGHRCGVGGSLRPHAGVQDRLGEAVWRRARQRTQRAYAVRTARARHQVPPVPHGFAVCPFITACSSAIC